MKTKESEITVALLALFGVFAVVALSIVWGGFWTGLTLSVLWGWFAVPAFGLPALSIPFAIGTALIAGFLARDLNVKREESSFGVGVASSFVGPVFVLLIGWIVTWFV